MDTVRFTIDQYTQLVLPKRIVIDEWLQKYTLDNVHTVEKTGEDGLVCYGYNIFPYFKKESETKFTSDADIEVITALFDYDDFPWEVLDG